MAVWFVSHCGAASGRDEYVNKLKEYNVTVDIFGMYTITKHIGNDNSYYIALYIVFNMLYRKGDNLAST